MQIMIKPNNIVYIDKSLQFESFTCCLEQLLGLWIVKKSMFQSFYSTFSVNYQAWFQNMQKKWQVADISKTSKKLQKMMPLEKALPYLSSKL